MKKKYQNRYDLKGIKNKQKIDSDAIRLIKSKASQLIGKAGFVEEDRDDLEQELMMEIIQKMVHYDPAMSKESTFMTRLVERKISNLLAFRYAQCRDWRLQEYIQDFDPAGDLLSHSQTPENPHLQIDVTDAMTGLTPELRRLCRQVIEQPKATLAKELGIHRSTLYDRLNKVRQCFMDAGLEDYTQH